MPVHALLAAFARYGGRPAIVWKQQSFDYDWLRVEVERLTVLIDGRRDIDAGTVVGLSADYSPRSLALLLALLDAGCIVAPVSPGFDRQKDELFSVARVKTEIVVDTEDELSFASVGHEREHPILDRLAETKTGGLVLFSSGSAGKIKAVVHDAAKLLERYRTPRRPNVTIPFMLFDHIGGINTVLHVLSSGGTAVLASERSPEAICRLIDAHGVQVLPTTPTFINLLLLTNREGYDLSSLEIMAYGAERMPESTLTRLAEHFPGVDLIQNYGMSEVGIMRTKSEASGSLWMKLGGDGYQVRVRDGLLQIKADTAMLGYLNEASPFTEDGWLQTGDRVEQKGEFLRVLGRASDLIIVGGEKVYPAEVEDLIMTMPGVVDVIVSGEPNAITGQIVKAEVQLTTEESRTELRKRLTEFLSGKLAPFKIPQRVKISAEPLHSARMKKRRSE